MNRAALAFVATFGTAVLAACGSSADTAADTPVDSGANVNAVVDGNADADPAADLAAAAKDSLAGSGPGLELATDDANRIAPRLEQYYFAKGYPKDLAGARASMKPAGQKVSEGNRLAGYSFDEADREFILCIQHSSGAWATYDTAPMATGATGESGGCPKDLRAKAAGHSGH